MEISRKTVGILAVALCLLWGLRLSGQVRSGGVGRSGGFRGGGVRAGGMRGGHGRGASGRVRGGAIVGRGLPQVRSTPSRRQARVSGRGLPGAARRTGVRHPVATVGSPPRFPGTDQVLFPNHPRGRSHGNVIAPGTPGRIKHGNVIAPGTPRAFSGGIDHGHHGARSKILNFGHDFGHGHHFGIPIIYVPYGYTHYVREDEHFLEEETEESPYVSEVEPETRTNSSSDYVIHVESDQGPPAPASAKVFEVRPAGAQEQTEGPQAGETGRRDLAQQPSSDQPAKEPTLYLIALKDGTIYTSEQHWIESDTLHYVTRSGAHNLVSIEDVDMALTARLNRERGLSFVIEVRESAP